MDILKSVVVWIAAILILGIMFPVSLLIWILTLPFDRQRVVIHWILVLQAMILSRVIPIWKIRIEGRKKADRKTTYVIISNHQSILDILLISCLRYRYKWISKIENMRVPLVGWYLRMAGYLTVNRGDEDSKNEMLGQALKLLGKGISIMLFPEGTRSLNGEIGFYKRGAFMLATQAGVPILPVLIDGTSSILPKHGLIFGSGYKVIIKVLDPVYPKDFGTDDPDLLAAEICRMMKSELKALRSTLK